MSEREEAERLYGLLDDISTLGDQMKPEQDAYFKAVNKLCEQRSGAITSDGYKLIWLPESSQSGVEKVEYWKEQERLQSKRGDIWEHETLKLRKENEALRSQVEKLEKEIKYLRHYGNKDCTEYADLALKHGEMEKP